MNLVGVIYKLTNKISGKVYIGQTQKKDPMKRIKGHFRKQKRPNVINKAAMSYGIDNFTIEILISCFDLEYLNEMEIFFIKYYDCRVPNGYNLEGGGHNHRDLHPQTLLKMSLIKKHKCKPTVKKGTKQSKEHRENLSKVRKGFTSKNRRNARRHSNKVRKLKGDFIKIKAINISTGEEKSYLTIVDCCKDLNLDESCVSRVCRGLQGRTQHKGYKFETEKYGKSLDNLEKTCKTCHDDKTKEENQKRKELRNGLARKIK